MFAREIGDRDAALGEDVEPEQHRPEPVLLADMVGAGARALLAAQRGEAGVEQIAEELPTRRRLEALDAELGGDAVRGGAGRHRARDAGQALGIARREMRVGRQHRERIRGRDEQPAADDQIAVAVAVGGGAEIGRLRRHQQVVELLGVGEIGIGMMAAEIGQRRSVDHRARARLQFALEDRMRVGAGDRVHRVEAHAEAGSEQRADRVEVEQRAHQRGVVLYGIDDRDRRAADRAFADRVEIDVRRIERAVGVDRLGARVDRVGDLLGRRAAVARCCT